MHEGACRLGCCCFQAATELPEQLFSIKTFRPTVVVGKPTPLRSLGLALKADGVKTRIVGVKKLILSGESASAELRLQLEELWDAECFDRYGLTEAGPVAGECAAHPGGIHLLESEYIAELIDPNTTRPVREDESGELVLTTLGRFCQPIVRYRTGDFARLIRHHHCACGRTEPLLVGGITRKQTSENISPAKIARRIIATARQHNPFYENASTP